jgi:ubiquitin-protein ligase
MASVSKLNKPLWTNMTRLKLYEKGDKDGKFILEKNPFDDEEEEKIATARDEYIITGRVLPTAGIYQEHGFEIEMKLASSYPKEPPVVRILTPVYHPNIENDGTSKFSHRPSIF